MGEFGRTLIIVGIILSVSGFLRAIIQKITITCSLPGDIFSERKIFLFTSRLPVR